MRRCQPSKDTRTRRAEPINESHPYSQSEPKEISVSTPIHIIEDNISHSYCGIAYIIEDPDANIASTPSLAEQYASLSCGSLHVCRRCTDRYDRVTLHGKQVSFSETMRRMDGDVLEEISTWIDPCCAPQSFLNAYTEAHEEAFGERFDLN